MKLTMERSALLGSLAHVQSVVERRNTIPILNNVRMDADGNDRIRLTATDLDLAMVEGALAGVEQGGGATAPAHTLYDIVRKLPAGAQVSLSLDAEAGRLELRSGRSTFTLSCLPLEDFPAVADGEFPHAFSIPANDLKRLIDKARFAMSTEETRYYLNGIYLHPAVSEGSGESKLRAVATDGHRLALVDVPLPEEAAGLPGLIIPRKTVTEVYKLIEEDESSVAVAASETQIRFTVGEVVFTSKLIDGTFPDYERVIPRGNDNLLALGKEEFSDAIDRVSTINADRSGGVKLAVAQNGVTLTAGSADTGKASEELEARYDAAPFEVGFNARYILDVAGTIEGDQIQLFFADAGSPALVKDPEDPGVLHVVMPMRV